MPAKAKKFKKEFGVTYGAYGGTTACKSYLYPLRRKIFIFKSLKRSPGLRTGYTGVRLPVKTVYTR